MRPVKVFYSWQSDIQSNLCRNFIQIALETAATQISDVLGVTVEIDSDTKGLPGTPAISDAILAKIRDCDAFVADMTYVATAPNGKHVPNPNVMGEYGYALSCKGLDRILLVMNTALGPPDDLPFDLRHLRHPVQYEAGDGIADGARRTARAEFTRRLTTHLTPIVRLVIEEAARPPVAEPKELEDAREWLTNLTNTVNVGWTPAVVSNPKAVLHIIPFAALQRVIVSPKKVLEAKDYFRPEYEEADGGRGVDEIHSWVTGIKKLISGKPNPEVDWYTDFIRPGAFQHAFNIGRGFEGDNEVLVEGRKVEREIVAMFDSLGYACAVLGLGGQALVSASLYGVEQVIITDGHRANRRLQRPFVFLGTVVIDELGAPTGDYLQPMMDTFWLAAGWPAGSPSYADGHFRPYEESTF